MAQATREAVPWARAAAEVLDHVLRPGADRDAARARPTHAQDQLLGPRRAGARCAGVLLLPVRRPLLGRRAAEAHPDPVHADEARAGAAAVRARGPVLPPGRLRRLLDAPARAHEVLVARAPLPSLDDAALLALGRAQHDLAADADEPAVHFVDAAFV